MALLCSACCDHLCSVVSDSYNYSRLGITPPDSFDDHVSEIVSEPDIVKALYEWQSAGCLVAILLVKDIDPKGLHKAWHQIILRVKKTYSSWMPQSLGAVQFELADSLNREHVLARYRYRVTVESDDPLSKKILSRPYDGNSDTALQSTAELASQWLNECDKHDGCRVQKPPLLPTRVIYVGKSNDEVYLHTSTGEYMHFIALSYCWGHQQTEITRASTLAKHKMGLAVSNLPKTIRDAIEVTRTLGFLFLWVDALCIVQDDENEMAREISNMPLIYSKSTLTISAEDSSDCSDGLLVSEADSQWPKVAFRIPFISKSRIKGQINLMDDAVLHSSPKYSTGNVHTRAWTLQEHCLSNRILYLGITARWVCAHGAIENMPTLACNRPRFIGAPEQIETTAEVSVGRIGHNFERPIGRHYEAWLEILELACVRNMSKPTDSLPTLSGLASTYNTVLQDHYLAGIWKNDLCSGLSWRSVEYSHSTSMDSFARRSARAPTWSCLSLRRPASVSFSISEGMAKYAYGYGGLCQYHHHAIEPENPAAPYGRVCGSASLTVLASLRRAPSFSPPVHHALPQHSLFPDDGRLTSIILTSKNSEDNKYLPNLWEMPTVLVPQERYHTDRDTAGLILFKRVDGTFERIGAFFLRPYHREEFTTETITLV